MRIHQCSIDLKVMDSFLFNSLYQTNVLFTKRDVCWRNKPQKPLFHNLLFIFWLFVLRRYKHLGSDQKKIGSAGLLETYFLPQVAKSGKDHLDVHYTMYMYK